MRFRPGGQPVLPHGSDGDAECFGYLFVSNSGAQVIQCVAEFHCMRYA
jgi:hypothetical protein